MWEEIIKVIATITNLILGKAPSPSNNFFDKGGGEVAKSKQEYVDARTRMLKAQAEKIEIKNELLKKKLARNKKLET